MTRDDALAKAMRHRKARAAVKRQLRALPSKAEAYRWAVSHLAHPAEAVAGMTVYDLLCACRSAGPVTTRRALVRARVGEQRRVGELTNREREALTTVLVVS